MDAKITPKIHVSGDVWITTRERDERYYVVQITMAEQGTAVTENWGKAAYDTRFEAAQYAQKYASIMHYEYEQAGSDV